MECINIKAQGTFSQVMEISEKGSIEVEDPQFNHVSIKQHYILSQLLSLALLWYITWNMHDTQVHVYARRRVSQTVSQDLIYTIEICNDD